MTKSYKVFIIIFISIFFSVSILLVAMINFKGTVSPENRNLATFPTLTDYKKFPTGFEEWLNDRFGFRQTVIAGYNKTISALFGMIRNDQIIFGSDGYSFLATYPKDAPRNNLLEAMLGTSFNDSAIEMYVKELQRMFSQIDKLNVKYISLWVPASAYFKYDYLPYYVKATIPIDFINNPTPYKIINKLDLKQRDKVMFPLNELMILNSQTDVYPSRNFHWADDSPATFLVASLIAERFKKSTFTMPDLDNYKRKCSEYSDVSGVVGFLIENKPFYCLSPDVKSSHIVSEVRKFSFTDQPVTVLVNPMAHGRILIFGNSFSPLIVNDISNYFNETIILHVELSQNLYKISSDEFIRGLFKEWKPEYAVFIIHVGFKAYAIDSLFDQLVEDHKNGD